MNRENGVPIVTWHHDKSDMELYKMIPVFEFLANVQDVRDYISKFVVGNSVNYQMANSIMKSNSKNDRDSYKPVVIGRNENYKFDNSLTKPQNINIKIINHNISNVYVKEELKENKKRDYKDTNLFRSPKRLYDDSPLDQDSYLNQSKKEIISHNGKYSSLANSNYIGKPSVLGEIKLNNYYDDNEDDLSKGNKYTSSLGSYNSRKYTTELPRKVYDPLVNDDYLKEYKTPSNFSLTSNFNTRDYLSGENKQNKDTINSRPSRPGTSNGLRNSFNLSEINNLISSITPKRVTSNSVHSRTIYETNKVKRNNFNENENKRISSSKTVDRTRDTKYSTYDRNEMINYTSLDRKGSCKNCFNSLDLQNSRLSSNGRLNSTQFSTTLSGGSFLNKFRAPESNYVSNTNTQKFSQSMRDRFYPLGSSVLYK